MGGCDYFSVTEADIPIGYHTITRIDNLSSPILWIYPYHFSCLVTITNKSHLVTFNLNLIIAFLRDIQAELLTN